MQSDGRMEVNLPHFSKMASSLFFIILALIIVKGTFFIVGPGQVGVTFNALTGHTSSYSQGIHWKVPLVVNVTKFDVKTNRIDIQADCASKDLQAVNVHIALNYHLQYDKVNELYVKVGKDYSVKVIDPAVNESIKSSTAKFPVEEIIVKREDLKTMVEASLRERLMPYNIMLENVNLVNITFNPEFSKVVEEKQIEEQKIKTQQYIRLQAEENKKKTILDAEAQAKTQELLKQSITKDLVALKWIEKWKGEVPHTLLSDKANVFITPDQK